MRTNTQMKGVFCVEGLWNVSLRRSQTVRPILELLRSACQIDYIYGSCATPEEFEFYLKKWGQKAYDAFPILYLATHGNMARLQVGRNEYDLDDLAELLEGKCQNRIVVCGSCSTLDQDKRHLTRFLNQTEALAICGYQADVSWLRSTAFELLLFDIMQENEFSRRGLGSIEAKLLDAAKSFRDLRFRIVA